MRERAMSKKDYGKLIAGTLGAIAISTMLFSALTESVMAAELTKNESIPTSYSVKATSTGKDTLPEGYKKANYTVKQDDLESVRNNKPTEKDLTMDQAAEAGAQLLFKMYGVDLQNATIYMAYNPATENLPRANWTGDVRFGKRVSPDGTPGTNGYFFTIDALTGEAFMASTSRTLDVDVSLGLDAKLAADPSEYLNLAKELAVKLDIVHGEVASAEYNCQGYSINDPSITIDLTGKNGEVAQMSFSRYDKKLTGVGFDTYEKLTRAATEKMLRQMEENMKNLPKDTTGEPGALVAMP